MYAYHVKTIYSLSMRLGKSSDFFFFMSSLRAPDFIHQERLVTSSVLCQASLAAERSENLEELVRRIVDTMNRNETSNGNNNGSTFNSVLNGLRRRRVKSTVPASSRITFKCRDVAENEHQQHELAVHERVHRTT